VSDKAHIDMDTICAFRSANDVAATALTVDGYTFRSGERFEAPRPDCAQNIIAAEATVKKGNVTMTVTRPLFTGDKSDADLSEDVTCHWAVGSSFASSMHTSSGSFRCAFLPPFDVEILTKTSIVDCDGVNPCGLEGVDCIVGADGMSRCAALQFTQPLFILIAVGGVCVCIILLYFIMRIARRNREDKQNLARELPHVLAVVLTLFDFTTDCLFLDFLLGSVQNDPTLQPFIYISACSIAIPVVVNILLLIRELRSDSMVPFWRFFYKNQAVGATVFLLAATNCSLFNIISSRLLGIAALSAPVGAFTESRLSARGIFSNLLEDLPQLVVQIVIASRQETLNVLVLTSILTSGVTLAYGVTKRMLVYEMTKAAAKQNNRVGEGSMSRTDLVRRSIISMFSPQKSIAKSDDAAKPPIVQKLDEIGEPDAENSFDRVSVVEGMAEGATDESDELTRMRELFKAEREKCKALEIENARSKLAARHSSADVEMQ
jgi:hypothetical protein